MTNTSDQPFSTPQESLWAGDFGRDYTDRNAHPSLVVDNTFLFAKVLAAAAVPVTSILELGANIGNNLKALHDLVPDAELDAVEINETAAGQIREWGVAGVHVGSILDYDPGARQWDLTFTKGVLIHINPESLDSAYDTLVRCSRRFIMVCEYYNPTPVAVPYRGQEAALFKRDFAGDLLDRYDELTLVDYGFTYRRDPVHPLDDSTWFLLEKN